MSPVKKQIIVFSQPGCPPCDWLKAYLTENGLDFEIKDVSSDPAAAHELTEKYHSRSTPTLVIGQTVVIGFDPARIQEILSEENG